MLFLRLVPIGFGRVFLLRFVLPGGLRTHRTLVTVING